MKESEEINKIVRALEKVPEKKLLIIELANRIPIKHGDFDPDALDEFTQEINTASQEAAAYAQGTSEAISNLLELKPNRLEPLAIEDLEEGLRF